MQDEKRTRTGIPYGIKYQQSIKYIYRWMMSFDIEKIKKNKLDSIVIYHSYPLPISDRLLHERLVSYFRQL